VNAGVLKQVFRTDKNCLGLNFFWRKKEAFFETGGKVSAHHRSQMSGNPV
jgi:hypothetical protein